MLIDVAAVKKAFELKTIAARIGYPLLQDRLCW